MNLNEPSAELDLAVAKAIEIPAAIQYDKQMYSPQVFRLDGSGRMFHPSRDMNHAMEAAKKTFDTVFSKRRKFSEALLKVLTPKSISEQGEGVSMCWSMLFEMLVATGPLAICAAILETQKGESDV